MQGRTVLITSQRHHIANTNQVLASLSEQASTIYYTETIAAERRKAQIIACVEQTHTHHKEASCQAIN